MITVSTYLKLPHSQPFYFLSHGWAINIVGDARLLEGSLKSTSRQLRLVERDAEVVVVGPEDRQASKWSAIMQDNG